MATTEDEKRATFLLDAQNKALKLFDEIEHDLIRPGISEVELSKAIWDLGAKRHKRPAPHWHKRIVRSGPHTLFPYTENTPDRVVQADDILFVDLGPVFEEYEADFGRTYVLGDDPIKHKLRDSLEPVWKTVKGRFDKDPNMTGEALYDIACEEARKAGWEFGGQIAGHLVGQFPHERIPRDLISLYVTKGNSDSMGLPGKDGHKRYWILEIHLVDRERQNWSLL